MRGLVATLALAGGALANAATLPDAAALASAPFVRIDLVGQRITAVVPLARWPQPDVTAPRLQCRQNALQQAPATRGAWVWNTRALLRDPQAAQALLRRMASAGLDQLTMQVDPRSVDTDGYAALIAQAGQLHLRVRALAGQPDDVLHPRQALQVLDWVAAFNAHHPEAAFDGVDFDIEPYLLKDFDAHRDEVLDAYLQLLGQLHEHATQAQLRLGVVVPFWFASTPWHDGSLLEPVAQRVDRIAVMSYRTDAAQREAIANNALCIGELYAKPVLLGLELARLPDEEHAVVASSELPQLVQQGDEGPRLAVPLQRLQALAKRHWTDDASRVSFYPDAAAVLAAARAPMPYAGFQGWMIDGLDSAWLHEPHVTTTNP